jgi:hypothetical protein
MYLSTQLGDLLDMLRKLPGLKHIHVGPYKNMRGMEQGVDMLMKHSFERSLLLPTMELHVTSQEDEKTVSV